MNNAASKSLMPFLMAGWCGFSLGMVGCSTSGVVATEGPVDTPDHTLPKHEYPFDSSGKYREEWVKTPRGVESGSSGRGSSSASRSRIFSDNGSSGRRTVASIGSGTSSGSRYHTVSRGDTLWGISRRYGVSVSAIKSANKIQSDVVRTGQTLRIP
ncbi:MAG: LysM peptidoglycan-binding domain-containing protein [Verrucomicrobiota bacterium]